MKLETKRLILRPIALSDAQEFYAFASESDVGPNAGWKPFESLNETREILKINFIGKEYTWGICEKESGRLIGFIGVDEDHKRKNPLARQIGYAMSHSFWGRSLMCEAVCAVIEYVWTNTRVDTIAAYCYAENVRSKRVLEKCGFRYEGRLTRAEERFDGRIMDNDCYVLYRE